MPLRGSSAYYSDVSWFVRAVRAVPVIAGAALLGGLIGGFAVFAVDSALNWEPQARSETGAENQTSAQATAQTSTQQNAVEQHATKPVRIVGGAIPDPSAGMSGPPPAAQPQRNPTPAQPQISSQLLAPKPLGPATQLQPQTATTAASSVAPPQNQPANQTNTNQTSQTANTNQTSVPAQNTSAARQQPERWPDALSRAHQNTANAPAPVQTTPPPVTSGAGASKNVATERNNPDSNRAASTDGQDRTARQSRHSRRQPVFSGNTWRNGNNDDSTTSSPRRRDARSYDQLYDTNGNPPQRSYGNSREPFYGAARGGDQDDTGYGGDTRRYGRDARYRNRSRVITREQPSEQTLDTRTQRPEPFWGGGFFGRGDGYRDDD